MPRQGKENRLSTGWEVRAVGEGGRRLYINHETMTTTWVRPTSEDEVAKGSVSAAYGWEIQRDPIVGLYMIDHNSWRTYLPEENLSMWNVLNGLGNAGRAWGRQEMIGTADAKSSAIAATKSTQKHGRIIDSKISAAKARRREQRALASKLQQDVDTKHVALSSIQNDLMAENSMDIGAFDSRGLEQIVKLSESITKGCAALEQTAAPPSNGRPSDVIRRGRPSSLEVVRPVSNEIKFDTIGEE